MSNQVFPSTLQSLVREGRQLGISFAPQGSGTPLLVSGQGASKVVRNSAGNFTVTLQNQYRSLVNVQSSVQLASAPSAVSASLTEGSGVSGIVFTAGSAAKGLFGNEITVALVADTTLATTYTLTSTGVAIVVNLATGGNTVNQVIANFNAAIPTNWVVASALSGGTGTVAAFAATALSGGTSGGAEAIVVSANVTGVVQNGVTAQTITVQVIDPATGTPIDIAANAGNLINLSVFAKNSGGNQAPGAV